MRRVIGIACILGGWVVVISGLFMTPSNVGRAAIACFGIAVSLYGILVVLNGYYLERAIWKK